MLLLAASSSQAPAQLGLQPDAPKLPKALDIPVGVLTALSGPAARYGQDQLLAIQLAVEELERRRVQGDPRVRLIVRDTRSDPVVATLMTRDLIMKQKVLVILGPLLSEEAGPVFREARARRTPIITASAVADLILKPYRPWAFRNASQPHRFWPALLRFWIEEKNVHRPALWIDESVPSLARRGHILKARVAAITGSQPAEVRRLTAEDFADRSRLSEAINALADVNADGLILLTLAPSGAQLIQLLRQLGQTLPVLGNASFSHPLFSTLGRKAVDGAVFATEYWRERPSPPLQKFREEYRRRHPGHAPPNAISTAAYESLLVLEAAVAKGRVLYDRTLKARRETLRQTLEEIVDFPGIMGELSMGKDGDAIKEVFFLTVRYGKIVPIDRERLNRRQHVGKDVDR